MRVLAADVDGLLAAEREQNKGNVNDGKLT